MRIPIYKVRNDYNKSMSEEARNREGRLVESTVPWSDFYRLSQENKALTAQVAALRKALTRMVNAYQDEITRANNDVPLTSAALYQARSALAKGGSE